MAVASVMTPIAPPRASTSRTICPLATPPMAGLQLICPTASTLIVNRAVRSPIRADASPLPGPRAGADDEDVESIRIMLQGGHGDSPGRIFGHSPMIPDRTGGIEPPRRQGRQDQREAEEKDEEEWACDLRPISYLLSPHSGLGDLGVLAVQILPLQFSVL